MDGSDMDDVDPVWCHVANGGSAWFHMAMVVGLIVATWQSVVGHAIRGPSKVPRGQVGGALGHRFSTILNLNSVYDL